MKKLRPAHDGTSMNVVEQNVANLRELFPDVFTEGKIDFDALRETLGGHIDDRQERYSFTWNGKSLARRIAQMPSTGTLRPCRKESSNWETTQHLFIEGDNLEVLKLLQKSYHKQVKMIYIDPPYNTGGDFIYPDNFKDSLTSYKALTGQVDEAGRSLTTNPETSGRYHTCWLNMMYPRLKLARNLLTDDGVLVCHIDEHEFANLHKLCDEIFGEENNLGTIIWDKCNPKGDATRIAVQHEALLLFARDADVLIGTHELIRPKQNALAMLNKAARLYGQIGTLRGPDDLKEVVTKYGLDINTKRYEKPWTLETVNEEFQAWLKRQDVSGGEAAYRFIDKDGDVYRPVSMAWPNKKKAPDDYFKPLIHPVTHKACPVPARGWRNPSATMQELLAKGLILFGEDETKQPERKYLLRENMNENLPSVLRFGGSDDDLLKRLKIPFENPKPVAFAKSLIATLLGTKSGIVMDFFAGSSTTAHAVLDLNKDDGGSRRYIMVQLPEPCDEDSEAYAAGFKSIADVGKERIRRVAHEIGADIARKVKETKARLPGTTVEVPSIDLGFRVFKLDTSSIKPWDADFDSLKEALLNSVENIKPDRSEADVLYELLLKYGLDLTVPIEEREISGKTVYIIGAGALIACLADEVSLDVVEGIAKVKADLKPEVVRVVFRDGGFKDDVVKTNAVQILRQAAIEDVKSL